jgi:hypothetical protein
MRVLILMQVLLSLFVTLVAAAPIDYDSDLVRRISPANIHTAPKFGKDPTKQATAKACVEQYCYNNQPSAQSATVSSQFDRMRRQQSD